MSLECIWTKFNWRGVSIFCIKILTLWSLFVDGFQHQLINWYLYDQPRKYERLSPPWSHPVVLYSRPKNWKSSPITTTLLVVNALILAWGTLLNSTSNIKQVSESISVPAEIIRKPMYEFLMISGKIKVD